METEPGITDDYLPMDPKRLLERMHTTLNTRDLTNLLHLLQVDYGQICCARRLRVIRSGLNGVSPAESARKIRSTWVG